MERLSLLSAAGLVAGCGGGELLTPSHPVGNDGVALLPGGMKRVVRTDSTTYSSGSGSMTIAQTGNTLVMTSYSNGVEVGSLTAIMNPTAMTLDFSGTKIDPYTLDITNKSGASSLSAFGGTASGSGSSASVSAPNLTGSANVAIDTATTTMSVSGAYNTSGLQAQSGDYGKGSPTGGGGCHACPLDVPPWVQWVVAGTGFLASAVAMGLAIAFAGPITIAVAVVAAVFALLALVLLAL